jgi:hypothetical protein
MTETTTGFPGLEGGEDMAVVTRDLLPPSGSRAPSGSHRAPCCHLYRRGIAGDHRIDPLLGHFRLSEPLHRQGGPSSCSVTRNLASSISWSFLKQFRANHSPMSFFSRKGLSPDAPFTARSFESDVESGDAGCPVTTHTDQPPPAYYSEQEAQQ